MLRVLVWFDRAIVQVLTLGRNIKYRAPHYYGGKKHQERQLRFSSWDYFHKTAIFTKLQTLQSSHYSNYISKETRTS